MQVYFPVPNFQDIAYDSIPFRAGRYQLVEHINSAPHYPVTVAYTSFATYFQQHEAELAQANPFAECRFGYHLHEEQDPKRYVASTPADIFQLLL